MIINFETSVKKHRSWKTIMQQLDYSVLSKEILNNADITSDRLDISFDEIKGVGLIYSGDVIVGTFSIERDINCSPENVKIMSFPA